MNQDVLHELEMLRDFGFTHLELASGRSRKATSSPSATSPSGALGGSDDGQGSINPLTVSACQTLSDLESLTAPCMNCRLGDTRTNLVFGVGSPDADLMFVGEAPGRDEDLKGEPFVGRAGQLLTDIIKAMKLSREEVYIANVIKCRPPENRNPEPDELDACRPLIHKQIALIRPKVIVTLGRFALQSLTGQAHAISGARGQWLELDGVKVMPTYHPAYLLRNPSAKKDVWNDMKKVMAELGIAS